MRSCGRPNPQKRHAEQKEASLALRKKQFLKFQVSLLAFSLTKRAESSTAETWPGGALSKTSAFLLWPLVKPSRAALAERAAGIAKHQHRGRENARKGPPERTAPKRPTTTTWPLRKKGPLWQARHRHGTTPRPHQETQDTKRKTTRGNLVYLASFALVTKVEGGGGTLLGKVRHNSQQ